MSFPRHISRRDFLNGSLVGVGAVLLACDRSPAARRQERQDTTQSRAGAGSLPDDWYGYGGVGDFRLSHGNTPAAVEAAHRLRDGTFASAFDGAGDFEDVDLVIVGAGMAGLGAAYEFAKRAPAGRTCLVIDNHPVFGGEAKENEFDVGGTRLIAPQGANGFFVPPVPADTRAAAGDARWYAELGVPREFRLRDWPASEKPLRFSPDNYEYLVHGLQQNTSVGHWFADSRGGGSWANDIWRNRLAGVPLDDSARATLMRWHESGPARRFASDAEAMRLLDTMSYEQFLSRELGLGSVAARRADLFLASACGLGSDAVSAYLAWNLPMQGLTDPLPAEMRRTSFPGGNSGFARYFVKRLLPDAIAGADRFEDIVAGRLNPAALDRAGQPLRMRLGCTVVAVEHEGDPSVADRVRLAYFDGERIRGVRARAVIMASGGWMNRHVVRDLPDAHRDAYERFVHAPYLVANVALNNWRFLHRLGITAAIWEKDGDGFGFTCNIRNPMQVGDYEPPLDPDLPVVLSFYTPFHQPGLPIGEQVARGRAELFGTSYPQYERRIHAQMTRLFAGHGFDASRDVAGIVLNRWGHAFSVPYPGFFGGASGEAPRDVIRRPSGRVAFAHSELVGWQHWGPAADEGRRAFDQLAHAF